MMALFLLKLCLALFEIIESVGKMEEVKLKKELKLKEDFTPPSYEEWKAKAEADLKGAPFEKKLLTKTYEGITLKPLYTKKDISNLPFVNSTPGFSKYARGSKAAGYISDHWQIAQSIPYGLAEDFNSAVKDDLARGLTTVLLPLDKATRFNLDADYARVGEVGKDGVSISAYKSLSRALSGIELEKYPLYIEAGFSSLPIMLLFHSVLKNENRDFGKLKGGITSDPVEFLMEYGELPVALENIYDEIAETVNITMENNPLFKTIGVSTYYLNNSGASAVQEIAVALSAAVEYINALTERGIEVQTIVDQMKFKFGVGAFYFMEVAKLRAFKMLWNVVLNEYNADSEAFIHAKTTRFNQTKYDPYVNMLRTTTEAFSAVLGGVDILETNPFDEILGEPEEFGRRIARNTQIILSEESHLDKLIDPAGGSFYVESLTNEVAEKSWNLFKIIESEGGIIEALKNGFLQSELRNLVEKRKADISKRKSVLVGTNKYANPKETKLEKHPVDYEAIYKKRADYLRKFRTGEENGTHQEVLAKLQQLVDYKSGSLLDIAVDAYLCGATLGEVARALRITAGDGIKIEAFSEERLAEHFEKLRELAEEIAAKRGDNPKVFLVNMGELKQHKARADFSREFFEVGGFEVIYPAGFAGTNDAVKSALNSNADVAVICSTDDTYPQLVEPITKGIKAADKMKVVLAGYPKDQMDIYKQAGVDEFIYSGANAYEINFRLLKDIFEKIG